MKTFFRKIKSFIVGKWSKWNYRRICFINRNKKLYIYKIKKLYSKIPIGNIKLVLIMVIFYVIRKMFLMFSIDSDLFWLLFLIVIFGYFNNKFRFVSGKNGDPTRYMSNKEKFNFYVKEAENREKGIK
jgi:hypothetical protein